MSLPSAWPIGWLLLAWAALGLTPSLADAQQADGPKKLLIIGQGPDGHPFGSHEFDVGVRIVSHLMANSSGVNVATVLADEPWPAGPEMIQQADGVFLYLSEGGRWMHADPRRLEALAQLAARGGGIGGLHWAIGCKDPRYIDGCLKLLGGCHGGPDRKYQVLETDLRPVGAHPVSSGVGPLRVRDEFYYTLKFAPDSTGLKPLLEAHIDDAWHTVGWTWERPDGGRSFGFSGAHFHHNWRREEYRRIVSQGILWTLGLPIPAAGIDVSIDEATLSLSPRPHKGEG